MKTFSLFVIALAYVATPTLATQQQPDLILYDGVLYELHTPVPNTDLPLESLWTDRENRPYLYAGPNGLISTSCNRGYVAIWLIEDDILYLIGLDAWQGRQKADLKNLFPDRFKNGKVQADWLTGVLVFYTYDINQRVAFRFEKGKVTRSPNKNQPISGSQ
jgi:hypothetical protein